VRGLAPTSIPLGPQREAGPLGHGVTQQAGCTTGCYDVGWRCEDRRADLDLTVEAREALERLGALTTRQIEVFSLHVAGLTYDEISAATGHSRRAVECHVMRARRRLRDARGA
jgi:DNA-directed RNA polymerase specialized sigma24 family protein